MTRIVGTGLFVVVLVSFLMPWASVECAGMQVQATGLDMAVGRDVSAGGDTQEVGIEPLAALALLLGFVGVALFFARNRGGNIGRIATGVLGAVVLVALKFKAENDLRAALQGSGQFGDMSGLFTINWEIGFWVALLAFILAAGVHALELAAGDRLPFLGSASRDGPVGYSGDSSGNDPSSPTGGEMSTSSLYREAGTQQRPGYYGPRDVMTAGVSYASGRLTIRGGTQAGESFSLSGDTITIGRSSDNDVVLTDPTVSRHHARIFR
jgi:hypothetical protein